MIRRLIILLLIFGCVFASSNSKNIEQNPRGNSWSIGLGLGYSKGYGFINISKNFLIENNNIFLFFGIPGCGFGFEKEML